MRNTRFSNSLIVHFLETSPQLQDISLSLSSFRRVDVRFATSLKHLDLSFARFENVNLRGVKGLLSLNLCGVDVAEVVTDDDVCDALSATTLAGVPMRILLAVSLTCLRTVVLAEVSIYGAKRLDIPLWVVEDVDKHRIAFGWRVF